MAVASAESTPAGIAPSLAEARALAGEYNLIPLRETFIDDCETPVSAFLKLRDRDPAFLLESADQGRVGRYSFIGFRPRKVLRWSLGDEGDPYALAAAELGACGSRGCQTCLRSPAARSACSPTTWSAPSSRSDRPTRIRSGCPTWR